jgi:hypothetical protein
MIGSHLLGKRSPEEIQEELKRIEATSDLSTFDINQYQDIKIEILPDKKLGPARFKQSLVESHIWYAHPFTIKAMKKNILACGDDVDETVIEYQCFKCNVRLDAQFWYNCPYCESKIDL